MSKVYCKGCTHIGKRVKSDYVGSWRISVCCHPACFEGQIEEVDFPLGRKKVDNRTRLCDTLNEDNDCSFFKKKIGFMERIGLMDNLFGKNAVERAKNPRSKDDQILLLEAGLEVKERELAVSTQALKNVIAEAKEKDLTIAQQSDIIDTYTEYSKNAFQHDEKAKIKKTLYDKIDLD